MTKRFITLVLILLLVSLPFISLIIPAKGVILGNTCGLWHFDEGTGTIAHDNSGNGNGGVLKGGATWVNGKVGKAVALDGTSGYVEVPDSDSLDVTGKLTLEAWIYPRSFNDRQLIICKYNHTTLGSSYYLGIGGTLGTVTYMNKVYFALTYDGNHYYAMVSKTNITANTWTHVAATTDGTYMNTYINGVKDATRTYPPGIIYAGTANLRIGCYLPEFGYARYFNGYIDEVTVARGLHGKSLIIDDSINRVNATLGVAAGSQITAKGVITNIGSTTLTHLLTGVYFIEGSGTASPSDFSFEFSYDCNTWYPIDPSEVKTTCPDAQPMQVELVIGQVGGETLAPGASQTMYLRTTFINDLNPISYPPLGNIIQSMIVWVFQDVNSNRHWDGGGELIYSQPPERAGYLGWDNPVKIDLAIVHTAEIDGGGGGGGAFYYNIQDAIDAASPGSTIWVYEGTYTESLYINKDLTIIAAGDPVISGGQMRTTDYGNRMATIFVQNANNVVLQNLDVEGQGLTGKSYAILYENSRGVVQSCTVSPNTIGDMNSVAIAAWDDSNLAIRNCNIENFGRIGVYTNNATATVDSNVIVGQVYSQDDLVNYGIEIEDYSGPSTANITLNEIYSCDNTNPSPLWSSAAIIIDTWREWADVYDLTLLPSKVTITGNIIHNNYESIEVVGNNLSYAHNNIFYNNTWGLQSAAENWSTNPTYHVFDARNNYWGNDTGPNHSTSWMYMGNPYGPHLGSGDIVSDYVLYKPWTTHTYYIHDIAIVQLDATPSMVKIGGTVYIAVTVENNGNATETFTLITTYDSHVQTETITNLSPGAQVSFNYNWDTTGEQRCLHYINASAGPVDGETFTFDNTRSTGVKLVPTIPPATTLKINPSTVKGLTRSYIKLNLTINDLDVYWDFAGFDIRVTYNTTMLDAVQVTLGDFSRNFHLTFVLLNEINDAQGYVHLAVLWDLENLTTETRPHPYGAGTLFTIIFRAVHAGQDNVKIDSAQLAAFPNATKWCDLSSVPIDYTAEKGSIKVALSIPQDVNADGKVDILDVVLASASYASRPGDPNWNPDADIDGDGRITILDLVKITGVYGYRYDP